MARTRHQQIDLNVRYSGLTSRLGIQAVREVSSEIIGIKYSIEALGNNITSVQSDLKSIKENIEARFERIYYLYNLQVPDLCNKDFGAPFNNFE